MHVIVTVSAANSAVTAILLESHGHLLAPEKKPSGICDDFIYYFFVGGEFGHEMS